MSKSDVLLDDGYSIKVVTDLRELETLRDVWDSLAEKHVSYFPFLCFDWFRIWLKHFLGNHQLFVVLLCNNYEVEMIAPLLIKQERVKGINVKKIELIGNVYSPIRDFLFNPEDSETKEKYFSYFWEYISSQHQEWDIADLNPIPDEMQIFRILNTLKNNSLKNLEYTCFDNWYLDGICYSSNEYFNKLCKKAKKNIRLCSNRAKRAGEISFRMVEKVDEVKKYMDIYSDIYARSWKKKEGCQQFFIDWTQQAARKGCLRLGTVFLNEIPIASGFAIVCNGYAYFEKTAYDEKYAEISPGTLWFIDMIKYVLDIDRVTVMDFLRGDDKYKKLWLEKKRDRKGVLVFNKNIKGYIAYCLIQNVLPFINQHHYLKSFKAYIIDKFVTAR